MSVKASLGNRAADFGTGPVIKLVSVVVRRSGKVILGPIDLEVNRGERWVVLGPNGAGKTTLLEILGGRARPSSGTAVLLGQTVGRVDLRSLRGRIGVTSGSVARQLRPELSALDLVVAGQDGSLVPWWSSPSPQSIAAADRLLGLGGLAGKESQSWSSLSEGERQQVLIARALVCSPDLLLLDEPFAGLDLGARERLIASLEAIRSDQPALTAVLVTHHVEEIPAGATHALLLRQGLVVGAGPIAEVMVAEAVSRCFDLEVVLAKSSDGRWSARARL